jgi:hypothetical protein
MPGRKNGLREALSAINNCAYESELGTLASLGAYTFQDLRDVAYGHWDKDRYKPHALTFSLDDAGRKFLTGSSRRTSMFSGMNWSPTQWDKYAYLTKVTVLLSLLLDGGFDYEDGHRPIQWDRIGGREYWESLARTAYQRRDNVSKSITDHIDRRFAGGRNHDLDTQRLSALAAHWHITGAIRDDAMARLAAAKDELHRTGSG